MSLYEVQKLLFDVNREPKIFDRFLRGREELVAEYRLTEAEKRAILTMDFRCLYEMGVHSLRRRRIGDRKSGTERNRSSGRTDGHVRDGRSSAHARLFGFAQDV
jgi:hypothetical protein